MAKFLILQEYIPQYRQEFFRRLSIELTKRGNHLVVGAGDPSGAFMARRDAAETPNFDVAAIKSHHLALFGRRLSVRSTAGALRSADYVVLEHARRNLDIYRLLLPRWARRQPVGLWGHGRDYVKTSSGLERKIMEVLARRCDWYFVYTRGGRRHLIDACGMDPDRITVVQNSLDSQTVREQCLAVGADGEIRFRESIGADGPVILYIGALDPSKRLDVLIEACYQARKELGDVTLVIAGDGILREALSQYSAATDWIKVIGPVFGTAKAEALAAASLIAIPGRVGLVAIDSFASRVPIVTIDHGLHAPEYEYLEHGMNCIVSADKVASFAEALIRALGDQSLRQKLREGCDSSFLKYTLPAMVNNYLNGMLAWSAQHAGNTKAK
ncbi:glycosyltransferase family 4 protein [Mycolicibacterium iranicum]|uniref:glycosyltransferase family 4 protein n=1 Tax=Mycolicibacterium iranicum TaxID=912594 RepID=UPI000A6FD19B|nr:glycosyltransferase family 4 protein [Mycolicibacterium iranicum]